jgi:rhodanese-related sulfurtransferase
LETKEADREGENRLNTATTSGRGRASADGVDRDSTPASSTDIHRATTAGRQESTNTAQRGDHVGYDQRPDRGVLSARYGIEVRQGQARKIKRLEAEFGRDRIQRWASAGIPVEAMGKPRDMRTFRQEQPAAGAQTGGSKTDTTVPEQAADAPIQPKLEVSSPDDPAEREAEAVADRVVEMDLGTDHTDEETRSWAGSVGGDSGEATRTVEEVSPDRAFQRHRRNALQLVDVRSQSQFRRGHLPDAVNVPAPEVSARVDGDEDIALYCRSGQRSREAARELARTSRDSSGQVVNVSGGIEAMTASTTSSGAPTQASRDGAGGRERGPTRLDGPWSPQSGGDEPQQLQTRLELSEPNDKLERKARRVADRVMRTTAADLRAQGELSVGGNGPVTGPAVHRSIGQSGCTECEQHLPGLLPIRRSVSRTVGGDQVDAGAETSVRSATSGGQPLPESTRSFFEPRFGRNFSDVRIHTGPDADEAARSINAEAFTVGSDIAFAKGNYDPGSESGRKLLAHELTHVVQQGAAKRALHRAVAEGRTQPVVTVKRGDTLSGIAERARQRYDQFDGTYNDLWAHNEDHMEGNSPHEIYPGEKVYIPVSGTSPDGGAPEEDSPDEEGESPEGETPEDEEPEDEAETMVATLCHRNFRAIQNHVTEENKKTMRENLESAAEWVPFVGENEVDELVESVWNTVEELATEAKHCFVWVHPQNTPKTTPQTRSDMEEWTFTYDTATSGRYDEGALGSDVVCTGTFDIANPDCVEAGYNGCDPDEYDLGLFNCCSCAHSTLEEACGVSTSPSHFPPQNQGIGLPEEYGSGVKRDVIESAAKLWEEGADAVGALRDLYDYYF